MRFLRYLWASPNTLLGLCLMPTVFMSRRARTQIVRGAIELHSPVIAWLLTNIPPIPGGARALTLGHVILGRDADALAACRDHEHIHIRQYERWGPLFLPAYFGCSMWLWVRRRDAYRDNPFEREAYKYG